MDNSLGLRALNAVCVYMGHNVVADQLLSLLGHVEIDIVHMLLQLVDLLFRNRKSQLVLSLCQSHPETPPGTKLFLRGENILHFSACIALRKRAHISVVHRFLPRLFIFFALLSHS